MNYTVRTKDTYEALGTFTSEGEALKFADKMVGNRGEGDKAYELFQIADELGNVLHEWAYLDWSIDSDRLVAHNRRGDWVSGASGGLLLHTVAFGFGATFDVKCGGLREGLERAQGILERIKGARLEQDSLLSVTAAAELLGVSVQRVYQLVHSGKVEGIKTGSTYLVSKPSLELYRA